MGNEAQKVGHTRQADGGIDIVFWPKRSQAIPFLGAIQVKHHGRPNLRTGPEVVREMQGVLQRHSDIRLGMVVTNTSFVEGANWFAYPNQFYLRLRTGEDVARWMKNDFAGEWREFPDSLELTRNLTLSLKR